MPSKMQSLIAGRNSNPLSDDEVRRVMSTFMGLDDRVPKDIPVRFDSGRKTGFLLKEDGSGVTEGEIVFGSDIYPGKGVADPNSSLGVVAAAAHELSHYYRWSEKSEIELPSMELIDEALTSLEAILRYRRKLADHDMLQLVSDAVQRLRMFSAKK